jgi:hypothetical protein
MTVERGGCYLNGGGRPFRGRRRRGGGVMPSARRWQSGHRAGAPRSPRGAQLAPRKDQPGTRRASVAVRFPRGDDFAAGRVRSDIAGRRSRAFEGQSSVRTARLERQRGDESRAAATASSHCTRRRHEEHEGRHPRGVSSSGHLEGEGRCHLGYRVGIYQPASLPSLLELPSRESIASRSATAHKGTRIHPSTG